MRALVWIALAGCDGGTDTTTDTSPTDDTTPTPTGATGDTGTTTTTGPTTLSATCSPTENALRFLCAVTVEPPQAVEVTFARSDGTGPTRTHTSAEPLAEHAVGLYFMAPETEYAWTARATDDPEAPEVSGTFVTGLPLAGAQTALVTQGVTTAPMIGFASPCLDGAYVQIFDGATNEMLWYENVSSTLLGFLDGVTFTPEHTILALTDGKVIEVDLMGNPIFELDGAKELPRPAHHDVFRHGGNTYVLYQEQLTLTGYDYLLDGFYVFDAAENRIATWRLIEHFVPTSHEGGPFADDYSHANAIWVDDAGDIYLSFRHLSAIVKVVGDPASLEFGEILWTMANPTSDMPSDFVIDTVASGPADFEQQHNVWILPDGRLTMFDNRIGFADTSRVLDVAFDEALGTATIEDAYELPLHCDFQGGALRTPAGNPMGTCAPMRHAWEFDAATGDIVWDGEVTCGSGVSTYVPRFAPLDW